MLINSTDPEVRPRVSTAGVYSAASRPTSLAASGARGSRTIDGNEGRPEPEPPAARAGARRRLKTGAKVAFRKLRAAFDQLMYSFTPADLFSRIRSLGVSAGDVVLVHSSFDAFRAFQGRPSDVIEVLQQLVGKEGAILMPSMPFSGTAVEWAEAHPIVDLRRAPSRMGLVSEMFRRMPGVSRSIHPTHPAAAWGDQAEFLVADHWRASTPCGGGSPYHRLLDRNGAILLLGADITSLTFFHTAEALLADRWPESPFTHEIYRLTTLGANGQTYVTETRLFEPSVSRRRNLTRLLPELRARGAWKQSHAGRLPIALVRARDVLDAVAALAARGIYAYDEPETGRQRR